MFASSQLPGVGEPVGIREMIATLLRSPRMDIIVKYPWVSGLSVVVSSPKARTASEPEPPAPLRKDHCQVKVLLVMGMEICAALTTRKPLLVLQ